MSSDGTRGDGYKGSKIVRMSYEEMNGSSGGGGVPSSSSSSSSSGGCCGTPSTGHVKIDRGESVRRGGGDLLDGGWLVLIVVTVLCVLLLMR